MPGNGCSRRFDIECLNGVGVGTLADNTWYVEQSGNQEIPNAVPDGDCELAVTTAWGYTGVGTSISKDDTVKYRGSRSLKVSVSSI